MSSSNSSPRREIDEYQDVLIFEKFFTINYYTVFLIKKKIYIYIYLYIYIYIDFIGLAKILMKHDKRKMYCYYRPPIRWDGISPNLRALRERRGWELIQVLG